MFTLPKTLEAFGAESFHKTFKEEIISVDSSFLPLQQALQQSSYANAEKLSASVLKVKADDSTLTIKAGLFYTGTIAGCNCADDPSPVDEINEYCEVLFSINRSNAATTVKLLEQ